MKKRFLIFVVLLMAMATLAVSLVFTNPTKAEEQAESNESTVVGTRISITPTMDFFKQLDANSVYESVLSVTNDGSEPINFEVYAAPYSYIYSEENNSYSLGFSKENNYTQITHWISIKDKNGNYVERPTFTANPGETIDVSYKVSTPDSIPSGGQYAVLFAHTISNTGGIRAEASPGMVIYGRSNGETIISSEISDMKISQTIEKEASVEENGKTLRKKTVFNHINASAKVKNTGNLDFNAVGTLKVEGIFGGEYYTTPENKSRISVIPEAELILSDEWEETPAFGFYKATWTVETIDNTETIEMVVCLIPPSVIIISIILLTILVASIIILARKRKERRSRFSV